MATPKTSARKQAPRNIPVLEIPFPPPPTNPNSIKNAPLNYELVFPNEIQQLIDSAPSGSLMQNSADIRNMSVWRDHIKRFKNQVIRMDADLKAGLELRMHNWGANFSNKGKRLREEHDLFEKEKRKRSTELESEQEKEEEEEEAEEAEQEEEPECITPMRSPPTTPPPPHIDLNIPPPNLSEAQRQANLASWTQDKGKEKTPIIDID